jgi:hypothetical protein
MPSDDTQSHVDHLRMEQDHVRWSADHMRALSVLRRVEAHLYAHEAHSMLHRAEIARHDEALQHGNVHLGTPQAGEHMTMGADHADKSRNHSKLMEAIFALEKDIG